MLTYTTPCFATIRVPLKTASPAAPAQNPPPWIHAITGSRASGPAFAGRYTLRKRQSSDEVTSSRGVGCVHAGGGRVPASGPSLDVGRGTAAWKRSEPTGASAYLTRRNASTPPYRTPVRFTPESRAIGTLSRGDAAANPNTQHKAGSSVGWGIAKGSKVHCRRAVVQAQRLARRRVCRVGLESFGPEIQTIFNNFSLLEPGCLECVARAGSAPLRRASAPPTAERGVLFVCE